MENYPLKPPLQQSASPRHLEPDAGDFDKIRKWQEDRITRKLRGEYESAVLHLSDLVNRNLSTPLRIAVVRVEGAAHTRQSFLAWLINPHLPRPLSPFAEDTSTLESVLHTTRRISHLLQETDSFSSVEATIERSRDLLSKAEDVDVVFKTREKGRYFVKTSTEMGNGEGNASITARARNAFGGAETLEANISLGTQTRRAYNASISLPLAPTLKTTGILSVFGLDRDNSSYSSSTEGIRGFKATIRNKLGRNSHYELSYEAVSRHIGGLTPTASISMREASGQSFKSSVSHTWLHDTQDDRLTGSRGFYAKIFQEIAGIGGDAKFHKFEADGKFSRPLFPGAWISFAARVGHLQTIGEKPSFFSDRFQLGGPLSVRCFKANGLGPHDGSDSLGGDVHWSAGVSLITDMPKKAHWPVKTHTFVNIGRLDTMDKSKALKDQIVDCLSKPCISAGVGLIYRFDPVRVEANFGVPLVASKSDGSRRGFQIGIGLDFL